MRLLEVICTVLMGVIRIEFYQGLKVRKRAWLKPKTNLICSGYNYLKIAMKLGRRNSSSRTKANYLKYLHKYYYCIIKSLFIL